MYDYRYYNDRQALGLVSLDGYVGVFVLSHVCCHTAIDDAYREVTLTIEAVIADYYYYLTYK